uniref:IQ motif containing with AAA domain 1 n=1 Tax=Strigops habroptila TaxID=2489341 RepID=A0A672TH97_STRHB
MSQATYNKMWTDAQKDLDIQLQREREEFLQPEQDLVKVFKMLATSYIKYMQIFRALETAHDQLIHQQKRAAIRQVLDGVIGRILEMKKEMVDLEKSEFHYIDNILEDLKLLPEDIEVPIPRYFIKEQLEVLQQREKILDQILLEAGLQAEVWRGCIQRKKTENLREEEMIFLGMSLPPHLRAMNIPQMDAGQVNAPQGEIRERDDEISIKNKLRETEGLSIKETLQDQIGQCFIECRHIVGRFPDYPAEEAGGSMAILSQNTPEQVAAELAAKMEKALEKKDQKDKKEKGGEKEKSKDKKEEKAKKKVRASCSKNSL